MVFLHSTKSSEFFLDLVKLWCADSLFLFRISVCHSPTNLVSVASDGVDSAFADFVVLCDLLNLDTTSEVVKDLGPFQVGQSVVRVRALLRGFVGRRL